MKLLVIFSILVLILLGCQESSSKEAPKKKASDKVEVIETYKEFPEDKYLEVKGDWGLVWEDEFESETIDQEKWLIADRGDNYNGELQYYLPENVTQSNNELTLTAKDETYKGYPYTSGMISTEKKFSFKYGKVEFRMKYPSGKGMFPAVWMLPASGKTSLPEIDIFETVGSEANTMYMVNHRDENGELRSEHGKVQIEDHWEYHKYEMEWNENELKWFVDGKEVYTINDHIPNESMYLLINLAVGGNWAGEPNESTEFPSSLVLDYVKIYEKIN